jgi:hypothetical protein
MSRSVSGIFNLGTNQPPTIVRPFNFGTDAIERQRVSLGQSLIDADFEYGLQSTKWQAFTEIRKTPSFYEIPGSDISVASVVTDTSTPAVVTVTLAALGGGKIASTSGGSAQTTLAVTFVSGTVTGTIANNQFVLGLATWIPTGAISISAYTSTGCTLNFASQTITGIPQGTDFTTVAAVPAVSTLAAPSVVSVYGLANDARDADRGEGFFLVTASTQTGSVATFQYNAKGSISQVPSATISTSFTTIRRGNVYSQGAARIQISTAMQSQYPTSTVTVQTSTTHGLVPGTPIAVIGYSNGSGVNGNFFVISTPTPTSFTYTPSGSTGVSLTGTPAIYIQPYSSTLHRPFDVGVIITPGQSAHGSSIARQSKKVFRYQSGKGLLWSSGVLFCPNNLIVNMTVNQTITTVTGSVADASPTTSKTYALTSVSGFAVGQVLTTTCAQNLGFSTTILPTSAVVIKSINALNVTVVYPSQIIKTLVSIGATFATSAASTSITALPIDVTPTTAKTFSVYSTQAITRAITTGSSADALASTSRSITMTNTTGIIAGQTVSSLSAYIPVGTVTVQSVSAGASIVISYASQIVPAIPTSAVITVNATVFDLGQPLTAGTSSLGISGSAIISAVTSTSITVSYNSQIVAPTTLTQLSTNVQVATVPVGSVITIVTDVNHGCATTGASVSMRGISTSGYNGTYKINSVVNSTTFTVLATRPQTTAAPVLSDNPRYIIQGWHGAAVRSGCFDDGNGLFWEYDGKTLWVVKRSSTFAMSGLITVNANSQTLTGLADTSIPNAILSSSSLAADITYGETTATLNNIMYAGGTLYRGMQCISLTGATSLGTVSVQQVLSATSAIITFLPYTSAYTVALNATTTGTPGSSTTLTINYVSNPGFVNGMTITNLTGYVTGTVTLSSVTTGSASITFTTLIANIPNGTVISAFAPIAAATSLSGTFQNMSTRFQDQLKCGDKFTLRGMCHTVTSIVSQGTLTFNPPYRGTNSITVGTKICKIQEQRTAQANFSYDPINGSGNSGFVADLTKMHMIGIQFTWYGAGFIDFMIRGPDGNWLFAHRYIQNNANDQAYMRSGNLPVRYEIVNEMSTAASKLSQYTGLNDQTLYIGDDTTYWPSTGTVLVDNELITYASTGSFQLAGCTRAASLTYNTADIQRVYTSAAATTHSANTSVVLVSTTCSPSFTHWGSAYLMDGSFDNDRGYYFSYTYNQTASVTYGATPTVLFFIRLAPSVSNGIVGDLGTRDLLNRAQFLLQKLDMSPIGANGTLNIQGILNPAGFETSTFNWVPVNSTGNGSQPSFTQVALAPATGSYTIGSGERIFSAIAVGGAQATIDLSSLKELNNSVIGGSRMFPDGPDTLMILASALNQTITSSVINLYWTEAQA